MPRRPRRRSRRAARPTDRPSADTCQPDNPGRNRHETPLEVRIRTDPDEPTSGTRTIRPRREEASHPVTDPPPLQTEPRPAETPGPSDAELITAVRSGDTSAFGPLYDRHVGAARALARQLTRDPNEADDLVSEAFAKVLSVVQAGGGPDVAFRAYLLTALRR